MKTYFHEFNGNNDIIVSDGHDCVRVPVDRKEPIAKTCYNHEAWATFAKWTSGRFVSLVTRGEAIRLAGSRVKLSWAQLNTRADMNFLKNF